MFVRGASAGWRAGPRHKSARCSLWSSWMMLYASLLASSAQQDRYGQPRSETPVCCRNAEIDTTETGLISAARACLGNVGLDPTLYISSFEPDSLGAADEADRGGGGGGGGPVSGNVTPFFSLGAPLKRAGLIEWRVAAHIIQQLKVLT